MSANKQNQVPWGEVERAIKNLGFCPPHLVSRMLPLVFHAIGTIKFPDTGTIREDMLSAGTLSMVRGIKSWKPDAGAALSTWLFYQVRRDMKRELERTFPPPECGHEVILDEDISGLEYHGVDILGEHNGDELLSSEDCPDLERFYDAASLLERSAKILSRRELEVIKGVHVDGMTLESLGNQQGCSRQMIHKVLKRAESKLKDRG